MIASITRSAACSGESVGTLSYIVVGAIVGMRKTREGAVAYIPAPQLA
jgi:hypothetical protein